MRGSSALIGLITLQLESLLIRPPSDAYPQTIINLGGNLASELETMNAIAFLVMVFLISFTGALSPGPLTIGSMVKGVDDPRAGLKVSLGHSLMEIPLIIALFFGLGAVLNKEAIIAIGLIGGSLLILFGLQLFLNRYDRHAESSDKIGRSISFGLFSSLSNPYTWLWWSTVGLALIMQAVEFGMWMLPTFILVHLSVDFLWMGAIAFSTYRSREILSEIWMPRIIAGGGTLLVFFGLYFIYDALMAFNA